MKLLFNNKDLNRLFHLNVFYFLRGDECPNRACHDAGKSVFNSLSFGNWLISEPAAGHAIDSDGISMSTMAWAININ